MKKLFITLAAAVIAMLAANAEEKEKVYDFGEITSINAGFSYEINVTHGRSDKVKVVYDSEMEDLLEIKYSSTTKSLNLFVKNDIQKMFKNKSRNATRVQVYLEMKDIKSIDLSGAAKATFEVWQRGGYFAKYKALRALRDKAGFRLESTRIGNYVAKTFDLMNEAKGAYGLAQQRYFASNVAYKINSGTHSRIAYLLKAEN